MKLGIIGTKNEEIEKLFELISEKEIIERGDRIYYSGKLEEIDVVVVFSRWGKVAAAITVTNLIVEFGVNQILFAGMAQSLSDDLNKGDIVVAQRLYQHDMDMRPLMHRFEIPFLGKTSIELSQEYVNMGMQTGHRFLKMHNVKINKDEKRRGKINNSKMHIGDIATGDLCISNLSMRKSLNRNIPSAVCADLESAAVAQVCNDFRIPLCVIHVISDIINTNEETPEISFEERYEGQFLQNISITYIQLLTQKE